MAQPPLLPHPRLVLEPQLDPLVGNGGADGGHHIRKPPFLKASCASGSVLGCTGRVF